MTKGIDPEKWAEGSVVELKVWTKKLFSIKIKANIPSFLPGQFTKIGLLIGDEFVSRPYSFVNIPEDSTLEFYFISVPDGPLTSALVKAKAGDCIWVMKRASGFLTLNEIPQSDHLWMLSTGTAIGPFLSILKSGVAWKRFKKIMLIHAVRTKIELTFQEDINTFKSDFKDEFTYIPFVSRERIKDCVHGRIPDSIQTGELEERTQLSLDPDTSQVMICGNPAMVKDTLEILLKRGLQRNRRKTPGHITVENYW